MTSDEFFSAAIFDIAPKSVKRARIFISGLAIGLLSAVAVFAWLPERPAVQVVGAHYPDMPNDCAIVATEAAARLQSTGVWTRILNISYVEAAPMGLGRQMRHDLVVWQPATAKHVSAYDLTYLKGTLELPTESHDAGVIAAELTKFLKIAIVEARFKE